MAELTFKITNLNCDACVKVSAMVLRKLPSVKEVSIDPATGTGRIVSEKPINPNDVAAALKAKGYDATF